MPRSNPLSVSFENRPNKRYWQREFVYTVKDTFGPTHVFGLGGPNIDCYCNTLGPLLKGGYRLWSWELSRKCYRHQRDLVWLDNLDKIELHRGCIFQGVTDRLAYQYGAPLTKFFLDLDFCNAVDGLLSADVLDKSKKLSRMTRRVGVRQFWVSITVSKRSGNKKTLKVLEEIFKALRPIGFSITHKQIEEYFDTIGMYTCLLLYRRRH